MLACPPDRLRVVLAAGSHHAKRDRMTATPAGMTYADYLKLDTLLSAQQPISDLHDEMLFVIIHQTKELWMKQMLHELRLAISLTGEDRFAEAYKAMARISRIQAVMTLSWDVLSTLTPADYSSFRAQLGQSSGFQSYQYRQIEFILGNKQAGMLAPHRHRGDLHDALEAELRSPTLYDEAIRLLARRGFAIDKAVLERDVTQPYAGDDSVRAAWLAVYRGTEKHWDLYELAEELVDLEDWFQQWRFRHVTTVQRIIGLKPGTGGTAGVAYLRKALEIRFFPELWDVRTEI